MLLYLHIQYKETKQSGKAEIPLKVSNAAVECEEGKW